MEHAKIQELLTQHAANPLKVNSLVENQKTSGQMIKVQNFQALIDDNYNYKSDKYHEMQAAQAKMSADKQGMDQDRLGQYPVFNEEALVLSPSDLHAPYQQRTIRSKFTLV